MAGYVRFALTGALLAACAATAAAQTTPTDESGMSPMLVVYREEVRAGKGAAHKANENVWANAYRKAGLPGGWIGSTTVTGPNEAWFFTPVSSFEQFEKMRQAEDSHPTYASESDGISEKDGELLSRTSTLLLSRRPGISYQSNVNVADMRYVRVEIIRLKRGHGGEFYDRWREVVAAHEKAKMDEHWHVYQVVSGMPDDTLIFFYPFKSMADMDQVGAMHRADAYRDAMGESGRARMRDMNRDAVDWSQSFILALEPQMSASPTEWGAKEAFWTLKPPVPSKKQ